MMLLSSLLAVATACDGDDGDDNASSGETGGDSGNTNSSTTNTSGGNTDEGGEACQEACVNLESCGFSVNECLGICTTNACGECLASSGSCGEDCVDACAPVDPTGDGDGDPTGDGDGDGDTSPPDKECVINDDCGLSYECVSCNLTDNEGWCEQTMECTWDEDCGFGGKCGYNVETADYRCLPAEYCE